MIKIPCRGANCKKPVFWATDEKGTAQLLDPRPPVYEIMGESNGKTLVRRHKQAFVSHFNTCPDAAQFSKGKKPTADGDLRK